MEISTNLGTNLGYLHLFSPAYLRFDGFEGGATVGFIKGLPPKIEIQ